MGTVERILSLIRERGVTEKQFLLDLRLNRTLLSDWKSGKSKSYQKHASEIADYFGVSTDYLLGKTNSRSASSTQPTDNDIKFALFGGEDGITDEMYEDVKRYAQFVMEKHKREK